MAPLALDRHVSAILEVELHVTSVHLLTTVLVGTSDDGKLALL